MMAMVSSLVVLYVTWVTVPRFMQNCGAIFYGLELVVRHYINQLYIELDSKLAIKFVLHGCLASHPRARIVADIRRIM